MKALECSFAGIGGLLVAGAGIAMATVALAPAALVLGGSVAISTGVSMGVNAIKQATSDKEEFSGSSLAIDTAIGFFTGFIPGIPAGAIAKEAAKVGGKVIATEAVKIGG